MVHGSSPAQAGFFERTCLLSHLSIPSWLCIMLGLQNGVYWVAAIGFGIAMYGLAYFLVLM
jgi:beta-carotene 3-hydroxylase